MPKGKRGKRPDPLEIRFHLRVKQSIAKTLTAARYNEVYQQWIETGRVPAGFEVPEDAAEWRNSARHGRKADWRTGNNRDAKRTLLRRSLPATYFKIVSRGGGTGQP
jgi:hypothetical protein